MGVAEVSRSSIGDLRDAHSLSQSRALDRQHAGQQFHICFECRGGRNMGNKMDVYFFSKISMVCLRAANVNLLLELFRNFIKVELH